MSAVTEYGPRREAEKLWHHGIERYVTVGRKRDSLRAVWDVARGHRVSRWLRAARAERACADSERAWRVGGSVTLWIIKTALEEAAEPDSGGASSTKPARGSLGEADERSGR